MELMLKRIPWKVRAISLLVLIFSSSLPVALAQDKHSVANQPMLSPPQQTPTPPKIDVRVVNKALTVLDDVVIQISLTITDLNTMLAIDQITIDGPDNSTQRRGDLHGTSKEAFAYVYPDKSWSHEVTRPVPKGISAWLSAITHRSSEASSVDMEVSYSMWDYPGGKRLLKNKVERVHVDLDYHTPFLVLLLGIGAGAALLTLFLATVMKVRYSLALWGSEWIAGVVTGAIVLLATQFTKAFKLPITIEVRDVYGAIVLGLLSWKMITPLSRALGLQAPGRMFARKPPKPKSGGQQ